MNEQRQKSLSNRIAIITGSGRGLGAATAKKFAQEGASLVINDIDKESSLAIAAEIEQAGEGKPFVSHHDISQYEEAYKLVDEVKSRFGQVDILVNNAGITRDSLVHKLSEEKWDEVIRINLKGPFNMSQACAKIMIEKKSGNILNLASIAWLGNIGQVNYSASKAGVVGMTRTLALELAKYNIRVNAIAPGFIDSVLTRQIPAEIKEKFIQRIPLKRIGLPNDIANLIAFLVSDNASYITGQVIHIDGGLSTGINI
jgi:3-oxoacyl-[acyl-carrier protein] reductase